MNNKVLDKKISHWKKQLLDLSKRNRMINFKELRLSTLKITEPGCVDLYNRIAEKDEELSFKRVIDETSNSKVSAVISLLSALNAPITVTLGEIGTNVSVSDMQRTLKNLRTKAKLSLEEQGSNILYMCVGFIEWSANIKNYKTKSLSPLVLVPVTIQMTALNAPYTLKRYDDDAVLNPTLSYLFENELGYSLPEFDSDEDDIETYLNKVERFADSHGWHLVRDVALGLMSFQKISMYMDIERNMERLKSNPVINALAGDSSMLDYSSVQVQSIDTIHPKDVYEVLNADSSQQEAIMCSKQGLSFVMQGPPGTGKSQTIANIISEALGDGKKVLFVSEKMAALQVVYRRLQETHLADFCLPLHSYKANKRDIIEQLGKNLNLADIDVNQEADSILESLYIERNELNSYVDALHKKIKPIGLSCYEMYIKLIELKDADNIDFDIPGFDKIDRTTLHMYQRNLEKYEEAVINIGFNVNNNPWRNLRKDVVGIEYLQRFSAILNELYTLYADIIPLVAELETEYHIEESFLCSNLNNNLNELIKFNWAENIPAEWFALDNISSIIAAVEKLRSELLVLKEKKATLEVEFTPDAVEYEAESWLRNVTPLLNRITGIADISPNEILSDHVSLMYKNKEIGEAAEKMSGCLSEISAIYHISFDNSIDGAEKARSFLLLVLKNKKYIESWFKTNALSDTLSLAERFRNYTEIVRCFLQTYSDEWKTEIINLDSERLLKRFRDKYNSNYINNTINKYLGINTGNYVELIEQLIPLKQILIDIISQYDTLSNVVSINIAPIVDGQRCFSEFANHIASDVPLFEKWFSGKINHSNLINDINESQKLCDELYILEKKILADWDDSAFDLEYNDILSRFEVEYKGVFRHFKKLYREDRKNVQALSKKAMPKKISDDNIVEFLNQLKEYKDYSDKLRDYRLPEKIGVLYEKYKTDWAAVRSGIKFAERINALLGNMPDELIEKVCDVEQRHFLRESINQCIEKIDEANSNVYRICSVYGINSYNNYKDLLYRINTVLNAVSEYNKEHERDVVDICVCSKIDGKIFTDTYIERLLESVSEFKRVKSLFSENNELLCNSFEAEYAGISTDWNSIIESLKTVSDIRRLTGELSDDTVEILCGEIPDNTAELYSALNEAILSYERNKFFKHGDEVQKCALNSVIKDTEIIDGCLDRIIASCNEIAPYFLDYNRVSNILDAINDISEYQKQRNICLKLDSFIKLYLGISVLDGNIDIDAMRNSLTTVLSLKSITFPNEFYNSIAKNRERRMRLNEICNKLIGIVQEAGEKLDWVSSQFDTSDDLKNMTFTQSYESISSCIQHFDQLEFWIDFRIVRQECCKSSLRDYIEKIEADECFDYIKDSYLKRFYLKVVDNYLSDEAVLSGFKRNRHERTIEKFRKDDELQLVAAQARLCSMLIEQLPNANSLIKVNDEVSVLQKEINKRQKHMPLRKLFKKIPNLLIRLKPCLMMSPLSVSYFLEAETYNFDLVIFDEASQILPEDAIGAILRGKQVIIAGDIRQMPPTSFFSSSVSSNDFESDNDEEDDEIIASSILEEAAGTLPSKTLLWHYRSKNEGLIAFSNSEIYDNKLITFPNSSVYQNGMGVEYIYVKDGVYEGGGKNCNEKEAKECIHLLKNHIIEHPDRSLGIIAFSEKQQGVIQREVDNFRIENPQYEYFFENDSDEPFFVKNLENVQGDERDTIIFSICYAKDINGRLYMRFGPLGQQGGERRLNVAVTRAKCNVKLVGSLLPEELDLNRIKSDGVRMLRRYIEYAIHGESKLRINKKQMLFSKDEFCDIVADYITSQGFSIKRNIGSSDNRIDIAVSEPDNKENFIAGIECDGYSYKNAKTARDRDSLRFSMLKRMGWRMYRVWSTEWISNESAAKKQLLDFLNGIQPNNIETESDKRITMNDLIKTTKKAQENDTSEISAYGLSEYTVTPYNKLKPIRNIYDYSTLAENIMCILSYEQPVSMNLVYKRLTPAFGIEKMTAKYRTAISTAINRFLNEKVILDKNEFLWLVPKIVPVPKIPADAESLRKIEDISVEEIMELMKRVLSKAYGLESNDLIAECSAVFGYERRGAKINSIMNSAIDQLLKDDVIEIIDGKINMIGG